MPYLVLSCSVVSDSLQPHGCRPPGSSADGIFQAKVLEWVAISYSICPTYPCAKSADFCHLIGLTKIPTTSCKVLYNPAFSCHSDFTSYHSALVSVCNATPGPCFLTTSRPLVLDTNVILYDATLISNLFVLTLNFKGKKIKDTFIENRK